MLDALAASAAVPAFQRGEGNAATACPVCNMASGMQVSLHTSSHPLAGSSVASFFLGSRRPRSVVSPSGQPSSPREVGSEGGAPGSPFPDQMLRWAGLVVACASRACFLHHPFWADSLSLSCV